MARTSKPQYQNTTSGYGPTRADSIGFRANNPEAYTATRAAKAYSNQSNETPSQIIKGVTRGKTY